MSLSNTIDLMMRFNPIGGSNIWGIMWFICMNLVAGLIFLKKTNNTLVEKFFAVGAGMVSAHFFIHCIDMMSYSAILWGNKFTWGGYLSIPFMQKFGAELTVVYSYRRHLNFKNLIYLCICSAVIAVATEIYWGTTFIQSFPLESRLPFYLTTYIPVWIFFYIGFTKFFLRHE